MKKLVLTLTLTLFVNDLQASEQRLPDQGL
jgi:hypothetical protein